MSTSMWEKIKDSSALDILTMTGDNFLALDVSKTSTGMAVVYGDEVWVANITIDTPEDSQFFEVLSRRELKEKLLKHLGSKRWFSCIFVEDVYNGINPETTRKLYALNTAIDELILDGKINCNRFIRKQSGWWKSWLWQLDVYGSFRYLNDKSRVSEIMRVRGIEDYSEGAQDRLDALGMIIACVMDRVLNVEERVKITLKDIECGRYVDLSDLVKRADNYGIKSNKIKEIKDETLDERRLCKYIEDNPDYFFWTSGCKLGSLGDKLKIKYDRKGNYWFIRK